MAARSDEEGTTVLIDGLYDAWTVGPKGQLHRIQLPNVERRRVRENGTVSYSMPDWRVESGVATQDGFVMVLARRQFSPSKPTRLMLWRIRQGEVVWQHPIDAFRFRSVLGATWPLAVSDDEVAFAYLVDRGPGFELVVEQRSLATGRVLSSRRFHDVSSYSRVSLHYTPRGLTYAWAPPGFFLP